MDFLLQLDADALLAVNGWHTPWLDPVMKAISARQIWIFLYVAIAVVMWRAWGWRRALIAVVAVGVAVGLADFICASLIRPLAERMRPSNPDNPLSAMVHLVDGYRSGSYGFPSCHAANTFALAVSSALLLRSRPYSVFIVAWALLQCYSRMYLGVHYPGDLLVGASIGTALALAVCIPVKRYVDFRDLEHPVPWWVAVVTGIVLILFIILRCSLNGA